MRKIYFETVGLPLEAELFVGVALLVPVTAAPEPVRFIEV
jgi:hypothetical protein